MYEITVAKAEKTFQVDFDKLPEASREYIIRYGLRQSLNDSVAGAEAKSDEALKRAQARYDGLLDGTIREGSGGGAALSPYERALRQVVVDYLKSIGTKSGDAAKLARTPRMAFELVLEAKLKVADKPHDKAAVDAAYDRNWPKVEAQAKAIAAAASKTHEVEI